MDELYEVYALKYAERADRTRADSFLFDDAAPDIHDTPHPIDYFLWVVRNEARTIVVDTGYDAAEGAARGRPILRDPVEALAEIGVDAAAVDTVIVTHLHYDHAGCLDRFPAATFHVQASEMAFATGPCMAHAALRAPYSAEHVCALVRRLFEGRVRYYSGDGQIAPGVEVAEIGGHSQGLQSVRVKTARGWLALASDAAHFYESHLSGKLFPIVVDAGAMLEGHRRLYRLASSPELIVPGHDPLVRTFFPRTGGTDAAPVHRLDLAPDAALTAYIGQVARGGGV